MHTTGHKIFNRLIAKEGVHTGNVCGTAQISHFIRAFNETVCNGCSFRPGKLQFSDLNSFGHRLPAGVLLAISKSACEESVILYKFRHFSGKDEHGLAKEIVHGYVITRPVSDGKDHLLYRFVVGANKSRYIIQAMCEEVGDAPWPTHSTAA